MGTAPRRHNSNRCFSNRSMRNEVTERYERGLLTEPERGQEELPATTCRGAGMGVRAYLPTWLGGEAPKPKKKICCACPATKAPRDECIAQHGAAPPAPAPRPRQPATGGLARPAQRERVAGGRSRLRCRRIIR